MKKIHPRSGPITVPRIVPDVFADGTPVCVDGALLDSPPSAGPWRRSSPAQIIDLATGDRSTAAQVEVRESDGTAFTEFITTGSRRCAQEPATAVEETIGTAGPPAFATIEEPGFLPAEDVAVAIIIGHTQAGPSGMARVTLNPARLGAGEVVLFGRTSGTLAIRPLP